MPRSHGISVQNKFLKGLFTESTALNFPEDACTEAFNCIFGRLGNITRRLGIDLETNKVTTNQDITGAAQVTYTWKNVGGDGDIIFVVVQIGNNLHLYRVLSGQSLSAGKHATVISLLTFAPAGVTSVVNLECQFAQGNGFLFVTNPNLEPFYISYNIAGDSFTATQINLQERDFVGLTGDSVDLQRPTSLTDLHRYNLANQGWTSRYLGQSSTSITIGTGSKVFTTASTLSILVGDRVRVYSRATPGSLGPSTNTGNIMIGTVTAYSAGSLTVNVTATNGAGTLTDWNIVAEPDNIECWNILYGNYPNNYDVWWRYKNTSNSFSPSTEFVGRNIDLNTLAPKGRFILNVFNKDRAGVSGISSISAVTTGTARPSTCSFFAGRVFYSGIQFLGYNARIYFSQILTDVSQAGWCYEENDPTSETLFDLLPSDGGFIDILEAGAVLKMVPYLNSMIVICTNGVWSITGSQGQAFAANDYSIHKISNIPSVAAGSVVDVEGQPIWWTYDGIFTVTSDPQTGQFAVKNIIADNILSFFLSIPTECRRYARGTYDPEDHLVQWIFKSTVSTSFADRYVFDRILTLNLLSGSWSPWSVATDLGNIHGVVAVRAQGGIGTLTQVTAASGVNTVTSGGGANNVIVFTSASGAIGNSGTIIKYLTSYSSGGNTPVTFAEQFQPTYLDWQTVNGIGEDYSSYFVTGYRIHGETMRKFQTNYVNFFSDVNATNTTFQVRGEWDFSTSGSSGKWSTIQVPAGFFKAVPKRIKIRGHGKSMQFRVQSITGQPFSLIGWSAFETANSWI
jgi:hypothetical protein